MEQNQYCICLCYFKGVSVNTIQDLFFFLNATQKKVWYLSPQIAAIVRRAR